MRGFKAYVGQTIIVSTASFDVKGRLSAAGGGILTLRDAIAISDMGSNPVDGVLLVPEGQIRYVQVV
jgi:hypothetical protein